MIFISIHYDYESFFNCFILRKYFIIVHDKSVALLQLSYKNSKSYYSRRIDLVKIRFVRDEINKIN